MTHVGRSILGVVLVLVVGAAAQRLLGGRPESGPVHAGVDEAWAIPPAPVPDMEPAEAVWVTRGPWGLPPKPATEPPPPPPPAPVPVGVAAVRGGFEALFFVPGSGEVRLKAGATLPGGGRVVSVSRFRVGWVDRDGDEQEHELFGDPLPQVSPTGH